MDRPRPHPFQADLLGLPDEVLLQVLRVVEEKLVKGGGKSEEVLQLRTVCKRFQWGMDAVITRGSWSIAQRFCRGAPLADVDAHFQRQLSLWPRVRHVELSILGTACSLKTLIPTLSLHCSLLSSLRLTKSDPHLRRLRICRGISLLPSLPSLTSLALSGWGSFSETLPPLPSLRGLEADLGKLIVASPLPALENLTLGPRENLNLYGKERAAALPHLQECTRLRRLSLTAVSVPPLQLPPSLSSLTIHKVTFTLPLDLAVDLPELSELVLIQDPGHFPFPVEPEGLSTLLSRGTLRRLHLTNVQTLSSLELLSLHAHLTTLSLSALPSHLRSCELISSFTSLTDLHLCTLKTCHSLDLSHLPLQRLSLSNLPSLHSLQNLDLATKLTSLTLTNLPRLPHLPNLSTLTRLSSLDLNHLNLKTWDQDLAPHLPSLQLLHLLNLGLPSSHSKPAPRTRNGLPGTVPLDPCHLTSLTDLHLQSLTNSLLDITPLPLLQSLHLQDCRSLCHLSGLPSHPSLTSLELKHPMPLLSTLLVSGCPSLTSLACRGSRCRHLEVSNLPALTSFDYQPNVLRTFRASHCPLLRQLNLKDLPQLQSLHLTGLPLLDLPSLELATKKALQSVELTNLPKLTSLKITGCSALESLQVSDTPLADVTLSNLPKLTIPRFHLNKLMLCATDPTLLAALSTSSPIPTDPIPPHPIPSPPASHPPASSSALPSSAPIPSQANPSQPTSQVLSATHPSALPSALPVPGPSPQPPLSFFRGLRSLSLEELPGRLTLDQVMLQTGLATLTLKKVSLTRLPKGLASRTSPLKLELSSVDLESGDFLSFDTFSPLVHLTISGSSNLLEWSGLATPELPTIPPIPNPQPTPNTGPLTNRQRTPQVTTAPVAAPPAPPAAWAAPPASTAGTTPSTTSQAPTGPTPSTTDQALTDTNTLPTPLSTHHGPPSTPPPPPQPSPLMPPGSIVSYPPLSSLRVPGVVRAFGSVTELALVDLEVISLDVSTLTSCQRLSVRSCGSLTSLMGLVNLPELTSISLGGLGRLDALALISCPKLESLACFQVSLSRLHLENLPSLDAHSIYFDQNKHIDFLQSRPDGGVAWCGPKISPGVVVILRNLKLRRLPGLKSLFLKGHNVLEEVEISDCSSLDKIHLENLPFLKSIHLGELARGPSGDADSLTTELSPASHQWPPALKHLSLLACPRLADLLLDNLPDLASLKLGGIPEELLPLWLRQARGLQHMEFDRE